MNNRGNIMINLLFFIMGLAVLVMFISPITGMINIAQQSTNLNCAGYIDEQASAARNYSYNGSLNTNTISCIGIKLYIPYIVMIFLIAGAGKLLYDRGMDYFSGGQQSAGV